MNIQKGQNPYYDTTTVQTTTLTRAFRFIVEALSSYRESAKVLLPPSPFRRAAAGEPCTIFLLNKIFAGSGRHSRRTTV